MDRIVIPLQNHQACLACLVDRLSENQFNRRLLITHTIPSFIGETGLVYLDTKLKSIQFSASMIHLTKQIHTGEMKRKDGAGTWRKSSYNTITWHRSTINLALLIIQGNNRVIIANKKWKAVILLLLYPCDQGYKGRYVRISHYAIEFWTSHTVILDWFGSMNLTD